MGGQSLHVGHGSVSYRDIHVLTCVGMGVPGSPRSRLAAPFPSLTMADLACPVRKTNTCPIQGMPASDNQSFVLLSRLGFFLALISQHYNGLDTVLLHQ